MLRTILNIEQNKQEYRDVSVKLGLKETSYIPNTVLSFCNHQSDTAVQILSVLTRTEAKHGGNIEAYAIPTGLTCKAVDDTTSDTEEKKRKHQESSAYNECASLMSRQIDFRRSGGYASESEVSCVVREYN